MKKLQFFTAFFAFSVASCGAPPSLKVTEDFCKEYGKTFSKDEKIINAIDHAYRNVHSASNERHFKKNISESVAKDNSVYSKSYAEEYYLRYPDCCILKDPWPIRVERRFRGMGRVLEDATYEYWSETNRDFKWVNDVSISSHYPFAENKFRIKMEFNIDSCGKLRPSNEG